MKMMLNIRIWLLPIWLNAIAIIRTSHFLRPLANFLIDQNIVL